jgi:hypothetical protein
MIPNVEEEILKQVAAGKSLKTIAAGYQVTDAAILRRVLDHPEYKSFQRIGIRLRIDQRESELESAGDNVSVTRADRLLAHARWLAERLSSDEFGPKSHVTVESVGDLGERLRRARERVLPQDVVDAEVVRTRDDAVIHCITDESAPK